jgi:two-component system sensor kinase FixL
MNQYRLMFEAAPLAIVAIDEFGIVEEINPGTLSLLGYERSDLVGFNISKIIPEPHRSHHNEYLSNYLKTRQARVIGIGREVPALRKDGREIKAFLSINAFEGTDGKTRFVGFLKDITDRVEAEARLRISENLASVGEMSSSIAHEISNPLTVIIGIAEGIVRQPEPLKSTSAQIKDAMSRILKMAERISKITNSVRRYARDASGDPMSLVLVSDLFAAVHELCSRRAERSRVQLTINACTPGHAVFARETELCQVLVNIANNAIDAASSHDEKWVHITADAMDESIIIKVSDSGRGIAPELRSKIGQRFFTTKPAGKGTGLGLYLAKKIVTNLGGKIYCDHGLPNTTFVVELPKAKSKLQAA